MTATRWFTVGYQGERGGKQGEKSKEQKQDRARIIRARLPPRRPSRVDEIAD